MAQNGFSCADVRLRNFSLPTTTSTTTTFVFLFIQPIFCTLGQLLELVSKGKGKGKGGHVLRCRQGARLPHIGLWARRWIDHWVCDSCPVRRQTYGYLRNPSLMDYYSFNQPRRDGWLSWPRWLTDSGPAFSPLCYTTAIAVMTKH